MSSPSDVVGRQAGLEPLCRTLFLSAAKFGESINNLYKKHEPVDAPVYPEELAASHVAEACPGQDASESASQYLALAYTHTDALEERDWGGK